MYYIYPEGSPNHKLVLEARLAGVESSPYLPPGFTIQWRQNGAVIKSGATEDLAMQRINTSEEGDFRFYAKDSGSIIDFVINGSTFSNPVALSNNIPTLPSGSAVMDAYGRTPTRPSFAWTFSDVDQDPQFFYRIKIGTAAGLSDLHDTGFVYSTAQSYQVPDTVTALAEGSVFYWEIIASDGEKVVPIDPDSTTDRITVSRTGNAIVNYRPTVSDVRIDGLTDSPEVANFNPVISWTYDDVDGQPQQSFRVSVSLGSAYLGDQTWTYLGYGSQTQVTYNFDKKGQGLLSHATYYVSVAASDTHEESDVATAAFVVAHRPVITSALVNDAINPTNLRSQNPTFTWAVHDEDNDPITGYEIRVGLDATDLGTDSFIGEIWHPGFIATREAFETTMTVAAGAFGGCVFPKEIVPNETYYFQVMVRNGLTQPADSRWFTGYFKLNNRPTAENLRIIPSSPYSSDDLEATWDFVDDVGEVESDSTEIRWYKDGVLQASLNNTKVIPASETRPFEVWNFTVRPHDGIEYSELTYASPTVTIANRPPAVVSLSINPSNPKTDDALEAVFSVSDPDGDLVTVSITWYKNGVEQPSLANKRIVPPFLTTVDDSWYCSIVPSDGYVSGTQATSNTVIIANTRPEVKALTVNNEVIPNQLGDPNPTFSWLYSDADFQPQEAYHVVVGTKLLKTRNADATGALGASQETFFCADKQDGIVSMAEPGELIAGNEVFDSGVIQSSNPNHKYATDDYLPSFTVSASDSVQMTGYKLNSDTRTMELSKASGTVTFRFPGLAGTYEVEVLYLDEADKRSKYEILVDDVKIDEFSSTGTKGAFSHKFKATSLGSKSKVALKGTALSEAAKAAFLSLTFLPIKDFEVPAEEFSVLSGYVSDANGGIKLISLAGSATLDFAFPSGKYDIVITYVTESSGNPSTSISVNNVTVDSFTFESGVRTRTRIITDVSLNSGDKFKINGARGGAASARIKKVVFKPKETLQTGAKFKDGLSYYASVRVYDGREWSRWYTTKFTMSGWAWVSSVSNRKGWTIESTFALLPPDSKSTETQTGTVSGFSGFSGTSGCENDTFQGLRFYDGTHFGWLRLKPEKVELLVESPLEYALNGMEMHTYRVLAVGQDIMLYVDNELAIDGTGKFTQPTSRKLIEFGDIAGREQINGSSWQSFRYSIDGAYAPNSLVDYDLDEIQRFADSSIGRMKEYKDKLYVSVDPDDPEKSSRVYRYEEGLPSEKRSILALTKSSTTSILVDPNRKKNAFGTSGKFFGSNRGLQYLLGSKPFPFDDSTLMSRIPENSGWHLESNCAGVCHWISSGILGIDTTNETGDSFIKFTHRKPGDPWVDHAENSKGWTVEVRIRISEDGTGGLVDKSTVFVLGANDQCNPASGISVNDLQNVSVPEDDGLNAPGIVINDGKFQEIVQFFGSGIRLKYASLFGEQTLSDQFYTVRIVGKDTSIAVYAKGDYDRFFRRLIFAPNGLYVKAQVSGDQEKPQLAVDQTGVMHVVYQDSSNGNWTINYTKTIYKEVVARGSGLYSSSYSKFGKFVSARPGFGLPPDIISESDFDERTLFSGGASFLSWGVKAGDVVIVFSKSDSTVSPRKFMISSVSHETIMRVETTEDLSELFNGVEYVVMRGDETWLPPIQVSSEMLDSNNPRIILASNAETFVAYQNYENGNSEIYVRKGTYDPFYATWKQTARLTNARYDSANPDLTQRPNGNLIVVWQDSRDNKSGSHIYVSEILLEEFGVLDAYQNKDVTPAAVMAKNPRVAALGEKVFIVYEDDPAGDGSNGIYFVELNDKLESTDPIKLSVGQNATSPCIATILDNDIIVAWQDDVNGPSEIYAVRGKDAANGISFSSAARITNSRGQSTNPDVRVDHYGNVFVAFQDDRNKKDAPDLYVAKYDPKLDQWISSQGHGLDVRVESYVTSSSRPSLGVDNFGNLALAWEAVKDGQSRIAKTAFNSLPTMDKTVVGYFPLDRSQVDGMVVRNKIRKVVGSVMPSMEISFIINKSQNMSEGKLDHAKTVANTLISSLQEGDLFVILAYDSSQHLYSTAQVSATLENKTTAIAFVSDLVAGECEDFNSGVTRGLQVVNPDDPSQRYPFSDNPSSPKVAVLIDDGHPNCGVTQESQILANLSPLYAQQKVKIFGFGVAGANKALLDSLCSGSSGFATYEDDFETLELAFDRFYEIFNDNRNASRRSDFSFEPEKNGTAFSDPSLYFVRPVADVSLANPDTQAAFDLVENGQGFSTDASLLSKTGAVDIWMKPHWPSDDITDRVIFGNAAPDTVTPNTMVCGVRPADVGNDLYLRIVDSSGVVRETFANNPGTRTFDWDAEDVVHLRAIWDQNAIGTSTVRSMSFPTSSVGYACTQDGSIWKTVDGGTEWGRQPTGVTYELYSIDFFDASKGWACGEMGTILRTVDGGNHWVAIDTGHEQDLNGIFFRTATRGYAVGSGGLILYSTDGGLTWLEATVSETTDFYDVAVMSNGTRVIAVGSNGKVCRSSDDGVSYAAISVPIDADWKAVSRTHQSGSYITYVVGSGGSIISTSNLGVNWANLSFDWGLGYRPNLYGVSHGPASNYAYVVGQNGALARTTNGVAFQYVPTGVQDGIVRAVEANFGNSGDNQTIVAAGTGGTVILSPDAGTTQTYAVTRCGNLRLMVNGIELPQTKVKDGPFEWDPSSASSGLVFGDYEENGTHSVNAVLDEVVIYSAPPPASGMLRRKDHWIHQALASDLLMESSSEKRLEWGAISPLVKTRSYWTKIELFMCGAREPSQVFAWDSQIGFVDDMVRCMALDHSNRLWVGTENGISSLNLNSINEDIERWLAGKPLLPGDSDRIVNYTNIVDGLVSDSVSSIAVDSSNNVWAGTSKGLMYLKTERQSESSTGTDPVDDANKANSTDVVNAPVTKFETYTTGQGLPSDNILVVEAVGDSVFVGTDAGLAVITPKTTSSTDNTTGTTGNSGTGAQTSLDIATFDESSGLPSNMVQAIAQEPMTGNIWIGTDKGLASFSKHGTIVFDATTGMPNADVSSITIDENNRIFVGTGFGITVIDGTNVQHFQPSDGVGFGAILDGSTDGTNIKWFATSDGLLEFDQNCGNRLVKYGLDDGLLGNPGIANYKYYRILGGEIPSGGCNKALVNVAVNGIQQSGGFAVDESVPWVIFDSPLTASDKVEVCLDKAWRKVHDFDANPLNPSNFATLETSLSTFRLYRKRFPAGTVILGANFSSGASNESTVMYSILALPITGDDPPISSVPSPSGTRLDSSVEKGITSMYADAEDLMQVIPAELLDAQHVALPSADAGRVDDEYLELTLSGDAVIYVAYDSRSNSLPGWLRSFEAMKATSRVTDMETFTDGTKQEKLFMSVKGTTGCVYDLLNDPELCDISDNIAVDSTPPEGCATITRLNAFDEAVLALNATDAVTGVEDMQVSAYENFTTDGEIPVGWVPYQKTYNLQLPVEVLDPVEELDETTPLEEDPQSPEQFPDIEYTITHEHLDDVLLGTKTPGRVYLFNKSTQKVSFLFDTGEEEILSMVSFGEDLIVGTGTNGRAFRWDGQNLTQILLPSQEKITALAVFDNRVFFGTSPNGVIYQMDQFGTIQLFMDTNESSVNEFAISGGQLYWATSNDLVNEGDDLTLTTRLGHRHSMLVQAGAERMSEVNGQTTEVDGHVHQVVDGVVQAAQGHDHQLNGSRSGKIFRLDLATGLSSIVHADKDYCIGTLASDSISGQGLMFAGTSPNGKVLRYVPEETIFIKSFDTSADRISKIKVIDGVFYAVADDDLFFFDGKRWQFFGSVADQIVDMVKIGNDLLVVRKKSLGRTSQVTSDGQAPSTAGKACAFVRFRDAAGNITSVRDADAKLIECYSPCLSTDPPSPPPLPPDNPLLQGSHRIVEVDEDGKSVFTINGPDPFLSGNRVEEEVGQYYSEVFNGTNSLVQWTSLSWTGTVQDGSSITIAVRTSSTSSGIGTAEFGPEFTVPEDNDLTNLVGQFLQFRATLKVLSTGVPSPQLDKVDIKLRISEATHYYTTNFSLPDSLQRGILTYTGCRNPPATDVVFGISGKDSTDFSDYFVISPKKVFEVPTEHQTQNLRVGIKLISSPDTVPVVDEFALLFSLANDAIIRLNLPGQPTETVPPEVPGPTKTVITEKVQGHSHSVTFDSTITEKAGINGQTSINGGHSHLVVNGVVQIAAGHQHEFEI